AGSGPGPRLRPSYCRQRGGVVSAASPRHDVRSSRRLRADPVHRALRVRRGEGVDRLHDRQQRNPREPSRRRRYDGGGDGAHRQGDERQVQGNVGRRPRGVAGALLAHYALSGVPGARMSTALRTATAAWLVTAAYYFYQYTLRSAPGVMMLELSEGFGISATAT